MSKLAFLERQFVSESLQSKFWAVIVNSLIGRGMFDCFNKNSFFSFSNSPESVVVDRRTRLCHVRPLHESFFPVDQLGGAVIIATRAKYAWDSQRSKKNRIGG